MAYCARLEVGLAELHVIRLLVDAHQGGLQAMVGHTCKWFLI